MPTDNKDSRALPRRKPEVSQTRIHRGTEKAKINSDI